MLLRTPDQPAAISDLSLRVRVWLFLLPFLCALFRWLLSLCLNSVSAASLTPQEHIARLSAITQKRIVDPAGDRYTGFSVELLWSLDHNPEYSHAWEKPTYFLIQLEPGGYLYGAISGNRYYYDGKMDFSHDSDGRNHFETAGAETDNRYIAFLWRGLAVFGTYRDGVLYNIETDEPLNIQAARAWASNAKRFIADMPDMAEKANVHLVFEFD